MASLALPASRTLAGGHPWTALLATALVAFAFAPILVADIPAMVDYPNHLARMGILARDAAGDPHPHYLVAWAPYPNLAMDLLVPPLARWVGVEAATRLFYLAGQIGIVTGAMAVSFAVKRRMAGAAIAAALVLYSVPFAWGFVNFEVALGIALWGLAAWIALARPWPVLRLAVHALMVALLVVCHLFALGLYGVAIGIFELWRVRADRLPIGRSVAIFAAMAAPVAGIGFLAFAGGGSVGGSRTVWGFEHKLRWLFSLNGWSLELSLALTAALAVLGYSAFRSGWLKLVGAGPLMAAGFVALYLAMPFRLLDTAFVDVRILVAAILILPAFTRAECSGPGWGRGPGLALAALGLIAALNLGFALYVQLSYRADYREMVASFARLDRGARALIADSGEAPDPPDRLLDYPMYHAPTLAVLYADAFVPTLFTYPGKQPILPRPDIRRLSVKEGGPVPMALLAALAAGQAPDPSADPALAHLATWTADFDYVYVLGPADGTRPLPDRLAPVVSGRRFALYRVHPAPPRPAD